MLTLGLELVWSDERSIIIRIIDVWVIFFKKNNLADELFLLVGSLLGQVCSRIRLLLA